MPGANNLAGGYDALKIASDGKPENDADNIRPLPCKCGFQWSASSYPYPHDICCRGGGEYVVVCLRCKTSGPLKARPDWAISAWNGERETPDAQQAERDAFAARIERLEELLEEAFDILGGCDGAIEIRSKIIATLKGDA